ncbi:MAG: putative toxin-antitoxin system toxin component, PIN family, partial [Phycisphaerae bacterium]
MKTLKVILDTNVFVSGIFFTGPPYKIIRAWQDNRIQIAVTEEIIEEYIRVLKALSVKFESIHLESILETLL